MSFFDLPRQPYLDADTGANTGGGEPSPAPETNPAPEPNPEPQGGTNPAPEPSPAPQTLKVKYNHQEVELPYDEAITHIQKGMNYEKAVERARQEAAQQARDAWIAEQGYEWQGKPIKTEAEYHRALQEKEVYDRYQAQGLPEDVIQKLAKVDQIEKKLQEGEAAQQEQTKKSREYEDFFSFFKQVNGRDFDPNADKVPNEVFVSAQKNSIPLRSAYAEFLVSDYLQKQSGVEQGQKTAEVNAANASSSPGSVNGNGQPEGAITQADIDAHANDTSWMMKHYDQIEKVLSKKKG